MRRLAALPLACAAAPLIARAVTGDFGPDPYVPTPASVVERMLELARIGPGDLLIDLGSGDGRVPIAAAKRYGARGIGYEIDRSLVAQAEEQAQREGVADRVRFLAQDLFTADLSEAAALTLYLLPATNEKLRPKILAEMRPGARVVAHQFDLGDWRPDHDETMVAPEAWSAVHAARRVMVWRVPANLAGVWEVQRGDVRFGVAFRQRYGDIAGTIGAETSASIEEAVLAGSALTFRVPSALRAAGRYSGEVDGRRMRGTWTADGGGGGAWQAEWLMDPSEGDHPRFMPL